jgi:parvulin-like peptidyl-prolyl isomerase
MPSIVRFGNHQFTAEYICQQISKSQLLPQLLREIIIDDILSQWQSSSSSQLVEGDPGFTVGDRNIKLQQFKQGIWGHKVGSYYLERKSQLDRVICSIMRVEDGEIAQELFFRICSGEKTFSKLAFKYCQGLEALDGGKVGPVNISRLHPEIASQIIRLKPGQLSPLFTIDNLYVFVRLEKIVPAQFDDDLRQFLLDELFEQWLQAKIASEIGSISIQTNFN